MITLHRSHPALTGLLLLLSLAVAGLVAATGAAARPAPPDGAGVTQVPAAPLPPVVQQIAYGSPIWVFVVVALVAAGLAAGISLAVARRRSGAALELPTAAAPVSARVG